MINYSKVPKISFSKLDTSAESPQYLLFYNDRYYEVTESVVDLVDVLNQSSSLNELTQKYNCVKGCDYSPQEIKEIIDRFISPIIKSGPPTKTPLIWKREIVPASAISRFSGITRIMFTRKVMILLFTIAVLLECLFFLDLLYTKELITGRISELYTIGLVFILFLCSSVVHEMGHASACKYHGVNHGGIGFGLYLNFPVLYTDVSDIWRLSRRKRLIVNIAGVYFQLILLIPLLILYFASDNEILKYFILTINLSFILVLNPFFKFDGYWIASDLIGVPNLRMRSKELVNYLFGKLLKRPRVKKPYLLLIKRREKIFVFLYVAVVNLFFGFYFFYIMPLFLISFLKTFPDRFTNVLYELSLGIAPDFITLKSLITNLIFFLLILFILYRALKSVFTAIGKKKNEYQA